VTDLKVQSKQRADALIELLTARQALISVIKAMTFTFQPSDPSVPKAVALRESLPSPLQFILLLTLCAEAKQLVFENASVGTILVRILLTVIVHQMATFGATRVVLHHIADRIEKCTIDPKGYAWHSVSVTLHN